MVGFGDLASLAKTAVAPGGIQALKDKAVSAAQQKAKDAILGPAEKIPLWLYRCLAAFPVTGLLGLDHLAVGSTETTFIKLLVNLLTFGSWWLYDATYSINADAVINDGLKVPFLETVSVKAGAIDLDSELTPKTKLFLYVLLTLMSALVCGISYIFSEHFVGNIIMMVSGGATVAIAGYTFIQIRSFIMSKMLALVPGGALLSKMPFKMGGGGDTSPKELTLDFFMLSLLFLITVGGFALSSVRSKSTL